MAGTGWVTALGAGVMICCFAIRTGVGLMSGAGLMAGVGLIMGLIAGACLIAGAV